MTRYLKWMGLSVSLVGLLSSLGCATGQGDGRFSAAVTGAPYYAENPCQPGSTYMNQVFLEQIPDSLGCNIQSGDGSAYRTALAQGSIVEYASIEDYEAAMKKAQANPEIHKTPEYFWAHRTFDPDRAN